MILTDVVREDGPVITEAVLASTAVGALIISALSLILAIRALRLQSRGSARQSEFRDVDWAVADSIRIEGGYRFTVRNFGATDAIGVLAVYSASGIRQSVKLGRVPRSGGVATFEMKFPASGNYPPKPFRLHWTSPAGHPSSWEHLIPQIF